MNKDYRPAEFEQRHYRRWEEANYFAPSGHGPPYCIVIPPPNVTGTLHMGHAFGHTIKDALIRFHRMRGDDTLWQPGTDHAGIATQMVVERLLAREDKTRHGLGREKFVERVWDWRRQSGDTIARQMRRLGDSVDWSRDCFTMDPGLSRAVTEVFVRLYDDGLIYRGKRLVNWDPELHTAVSDLEVLSSEEQGKLWRFRYPLEDGTGTLVVATTRPETMLGDTAVAVHPDDARFRHLVGRAVRLPLAERSIPVVADDYVDPEFGTGCVKITPAHDFNDYEVGQRHDLPLINIFDADAALNEHVPVRYRGLDRFVAREKIVADLTALGLVEGIDDHASMIPRGDRSGAVLEPWLTDQWYVRMAPLAAPAIEAVEQGRVRFVPENWSKEYFAWMRNIQDWCISRQLWWGHRIPAWYDANGAIYVGRDEDEVRAKHGMDAGRALRRDEDVLDTWFSSALWPFSTLGWPERTPELEKYYPTSVLVTGFDIIFFWVARMVMMGLKFAGDVPFREVYIHALVRDHEGQKMSKSKGNILDPLDLVEGVDLEALLVKRTEGMMQPHMKSRVEKATRDEFPDGIKGYGTDALRMTFASLATTGRDVRFDLGRIDGYHKFCNKLWNASQYVFAQLDKLDTGECELSVADRWIRSRLHGAIAEYCTGFESYRFDLVTQALYDFTWHEFCDWYLELTKPVINDPGAADPAKRAAKATLAEVLGTLLKLLHPIIPFVTEELWLALAAKLGLESPTLMLERMPTAEQYETSEPAELEIAWLREIIIGIRQIRGEMNVSPRAMVPVLLESARAEDRSRVQANWSYLNKVGRIESVDFITENEIPSGAATALVGEIKLFVPLAGLIDIGKEIERLDKHLGKVDKDLEQCKRKLENARFVENAPSAIVAKERARADELAQRSLELRRQLERLNEII